MWWERGQERIFWCAPVKQLITSQSNKRKYKNILQLPHTHPQTQARRRITEEDTKQSTVAHRGTLDILKHAARETETEAGRQRRQKEKKWNILAFFSGPVH